jgi:hypothetical protein
MSLTSKQEAFAQAVASGMTQVDAYRSSYDVKEDAKPEGLYVDASKLMSDPNVNLRVKELRDEMAERELWTRLDSIRVLSDIAGDSSVRAGEKTGAIKVLNEMQGHNAPKEINIKGSLSLNVKFD